MMEKDKMTDKDAQSFNVDVNMWSSGSIINNTDQLLLNLQNKAAQLKAKVRIGNFWDAGEPKWDAIVEFKDGRIEQHIAVSLGILLRTLAKQL